jgi:hypothetical protein
MDIERVVSPADNDPFQQSIATGRLRKLGAMRLAEDVGEGRWRLAGGLEDTLRRMGERGDIIRTMQRELTARRLERAGVERVITEELRAPLVGRLIARGFSDEQRDRHFVMIDGVDGHVHYVDIGRADATQPLPEGATIQLAARGAGVTDADRTIAAIARAHGGRYSVDLHLRHDPQASEAFATTHVRRLEAMRRGRLDLERHADGSWSIGDNHLAHAEAFAARQQRDRPVALSVLSRSPVADLAAIEAPTWLDRELASDSPMALRDTGFGREVRGALAARRRWLIEQQLADPETSPAQPRADALARLRARELQRTGAALGSELGKPFVAARIGDRIEGTIARRVDLESGSFAVVERSLDFTLVPWRDLLERNLGKSASGILRTDGINWQFGRSRSGPSIG